MEESLNAVNDARGGTVDAQAPTGSLRAEGDAEGGIARAAGDTGLKTGSRAEKKGQSRKENAYFASQRRAAEAAGAQRAMEQMEKKLSSFEERIIPDAKSRQNPDRHEEEMPGLTQKREAAAEKTRETDLSSAVSRHPAIRQAVLENRGLREFVFSDIRKKDAEEINRAYPDAGLKSVDDLGDEFFALRAEGVSNLTAYLAVTGAKDARKPRKPPVIGAVNGAGQKEKEFYSPDEVDRLTTRQLDDPKIRERVMKSMTRWKRK